MLFFEKINGFKYPTLGNILEGLFTEHLIYLDRTYVPIGNEQIEKEGELNVKLAWYYLFEQALQWDYNFEEWTCEELLKVPLTQTELVNSASAVTTLLLYISTMETSFIYPLINKANISRDPTNAKTLGPFAFALYTIL